MAGMFHRDSTRINRRNLACASASLAGTVVMIAVAAASAQSAAQPTARVAPASIHSPTTVPAVANSEPAYSRSLKVPEEMIRRRPRQAIVLPSEPREMGEDPLQVSGGAVGKLATEPRLLPEGHIIAGAMAEFAAEDGDTTCYVPAEQLLSRAPAEAKSWLGDLDAGRVPLALVRDLQVKNIALPADAHVAVEEPGLRWRLTGPKRAMLVEVDERGVVVRSILPLRVLPNKRLTMLEAIAGATRDLPAFVVTGRVTEFQGRNYILLEHLAEETQRPSIPPEPAEPTRPAASPGEGAGTNGTATQPAVANPEDIIQHLLETKPRRALAMPATAPAVDTAATMSRPSEGTTAEDSSLMPEDTMLVDRPGRIVPGDKWWMFAFEDKGTQAASKPIRLLPNRMLETAIGLGADESLGVVLIVSGEVTEHRGQNYLLLRKVLIQRDWGNLR